MSLDCETPMGQLFIKEQKRVEKMISNCGYTVVSTSCNDHRSDIILSKEIEGRLTICGVGEIKARISAGGRPLTVDYLRENGGYLITSDKLKYGAMMSSMLSAPFFVIVSVIADQTILIWKITDKLGDYTEKFVTRETKTIKTVNGGEVVRTNAFLSMDSPNLTIIDERNFGRNTV